MSFPQKIVLGIAALAIALMVLFPPWVFVYHYEPDTNFRGSGSEQRIERPAGYRPIWEPHIANDQSSLIGIFGIEPSRSSLKYFSMRIDKERLWIQILGALIVAVFVVALLRPERRAS